jgi:DNA helicase-2/ATP-dependent DNA helicase PcrA
MSFAPFKDNLEASLQDNVIRTRAARNLSEISRMIAKYNFLHNMHDLTPVNKIAMPEEFFNVYVKYLYIDGIGEYEDESEYAPKGCVSFMTIHQSKGLEFPVVVVGSLGNVPKKNSDVLMTSVENRFFHRPSYEPMGDIKFFDFWRLYYTAFSRAQNLLVLATKKEDSKYFGPYISELPRITEFSSNVKFENVKNVNYKHVYSFTSHIAVYDGCPTQYKFYKEYAFAQNKMFHTSVGSLVHATLEDMNNCVIDGHPERVNEETLRKWFELNYKNMQGQTGYYLTDEQKENALSQVIRYFQHRKNELGRVWKAEEEINLVLPEYILRGVIDLVEGKGDTVEIVDYKTGPKPDIEGHPERVEHYKKQLEIYAYLIEKRYAKKVSQMHLYYTSTQEGNPMISFVWERDAIDKTVQEITQTVHDIEGKKFDSKVQNSYACEFCDMKYVCGKTNA